jgi:CDGSH-type Zn-finger protein
LEEPSHIDCGPRLVFSLPAAKPKKNCSAPDAKELAMARMVKHERNLPYEVPEGTELPLYICACGLSKNKPFCDGSHRKTKDENAADVYVYDDSGRVQVVKQY